MKKLPLRIIKGIAKFLLREFPFDDDFDNFQHTGPMIQPVDRWPQAADDKLAEPRLRGAIPRDIVEGAHEGSLIPRIEQIGKRLGERFAQHEEERIAGILSRNDSAKLPQGHRRPPRGFSDNHTTTPTGRH